MRRPIAARILAASLALVVGLSLTATSGLSVISAQTATPGQTAIPATFIQLTDVADHWARSQIESGVADGYINGFPDGSFWPDRLITRAEFFKLLASALRLTPQPTMVSPFAEREHWSMRKGQVQAAIGGGLLNPADYGPWLVPDTPIQRREIVLAAVRATGKEELVGRWSLASPDAATYPDWLQDWAAAAVADGLLGGYEDGSLRLERTATRAEAVVIVQRILQRVTMKLSATEVAPAPEISRYPCEGEPTWRVTAESADRPRFSDGAYTYGVDLTVKSHRLIPAPGGAAWLVLTIPEAVGGDITLLWRLQGGRTTEIGRFTDRVTPLAVAGDGRLWLSQGSDLVAVRADGVLRTISVGEPLACGAVDSGGNLWAAGSGTLYRASPDGRLLRLSTGLTGEPVRHLELGDDGSVWLLRPGTGDEAWLEGVRISVEAGDRPTARVMQRERLLPRFFGGQGRSVQAALLGGSGSIRWVVVVAAGGTARERQESLFRLDLATGAFTRLVPPRSAGLWSSLMPAPDGSPLLRDSAGQFWRVGI